MESIGACSAAKLTSYQVNGKKTITPKPETEEYNVRNFVYSRQRPFHPRRLWALVYDKFILQMEQTDDNEDDVMDEDEEDDDAADDAEGEEMEDEDGKQEDDDDPMDMPPNDVILANKRDHPLFSRLFRSKGEFFLCTRPHRAGEWSQAGAMLTLTGGRAWFCTLPEEEYTTGDEQIDSLVKHDMAKGGEWGDRRQEIVFIGENLDIPVLTETLDKCLLTDKEFEKWEEVMRNGPEDNEGKQKALQDVFDDGFPDWPEDDDGDHDGHDHGPGHRH